MNDEEYLLIAWSPGERPVCAVCGKFVDAYMAMLTDDGSPQPMGIWCPHCGPCKTREEHLEATYGATVWQHPDIKFRIPSTPEAWEIFRNLVERKYPGIEMGAEA